MHRLLRIAAFSCLATVAHAQHSSTNTLTVDPSGNADYTTIQAAIDSLSNPTVRTTILIYAGTYTEEVTLGTTSDNIDLIGVDPISVVIVAPENTDAVTIEGTGVRNNSVQNLTIRTDDDTINEGRGIVIKKAGTGDDPSAIQIIGVRIETVGKRSPAIKMDDACNDIEITGVYIRNTGDFSATIDGELGTDVIVTGCDISCHDGRLLPGDNWLIANSVLESARAASGGSSADDTAPIELWGHDNLIVDNCTLRGRGFGIVIQNDSDNVVVSNCDIEGGLAGVRIKCGTNIRFQNCRIVANSDLGKTTAMDVEYTGVRVKEATVACTSLSSITFAGCEISAYSDETNRDAIGVLVEGAPADGPVRFLDCTILAEVTTNGDRAFGVAAGDLGSTPAGDPDSVAVVGGSIDTVNGDERETDLYDLYNESPDDAVWIRTSGTQFSRWFGEIDAAVGQEVEVLRVVNIPSAGAAKVLAATTLLATERIITANITDPEIYRVLSVTGNKSGMVGNVIIIGQDWALRPIADSITLNGTATVKGVKAFRKVRKIILPAWTTALNGETVSIGTTETLGLHSPISETDDLLQIGQKASAASAYTLQSTVPTPNAIRGTVDISPISPADGDSIEFTYRASK
ncbi:MAG: pectinesterase family protein [Planctomycetota bacterium]|nr:pectinesterase family protein [Planctomycetota bacterium]